jgi:hypothetical protein
VIRQTDPNTPSAQAPATHTPDGAPPKPTTKPQPPASKVLLKDSGNGDKKTATFHVDGDWKLTFNCRSDNQYLSTTDLYITIYNSDGTYDSDISHTCSRTYGGDQSIEHAPFSGDKYLDVSAYGATWDVTIESI